MVAASEIGRRARAPADEGVTIAYFSGTNTHDRDFLAAAGALLEVLRTRPEVRLLVVGPLELDDRFLPFADRIERMPLQPWERLAHVQATADLAIAPLELENPFAQAKSAVKWLEAGLQEVPLVASPIHDFTRVVEHGRTGFLASDEDEWHRTLLQLVDDDQLRREVGLNARAAILERWTTRRTALAYRDRLGKLV
jgi:glycosyltransferase involved in cell wall biosynthesis